MTTIRLTAVFATVLGVLLLAGMPALATNDPIPGVDIIVRRNPGGVAIHATSDKSGNFTFDNLAPGKYTLSVAAPQTKQVSTTRSNIKHPNNEKVSGVQVATVAVELGTGAASIEIEITEKKGKIVGKVTHAEAPPAKTNPK